MDTGKLKKSETTAFFTCTCSKEIIIYIKEIKNSFDENPYKYTCECGKYYIINWA